MKVSKISLLTATLGSLMLFAPMSNAQDSTKDSAPAERPAARQRERRPGGPGGANQLDRMAERLKLTDDQKAKLKPILDEERTKMREVRQDTALTQEQRREKIREISKEYLGKMKTVLTTEQAEQLQKMREQGPGRGPRGARAGGSDQPVPNKDKQQ